MDADSKSSPDRDPEPRPAQIRAGKTACRIALVYPGDRETRLRSAPEESRFLPLFEALSQFGARVEPAVYHDDFCDEVRRQLEGVDGVLVWVNPVQDGRDRRVLEAMLRSVAAEGVFVSAHPDVVAKLGTKEVLHRTRDLGWGCDTHLYRSVQRMRRELPDRLATGPRVLKQIRGNGGRGVWKVELETGPGTGSETCVRVRHALRGAREERLTLDALCLRCEPYFIAGGGMIDQAYQARLPDGTIRCYLVHGRVAGFGLQAINALHPPAPGAGPETAPEPGPRLYHPPTLSEYRRLKDTLERDWVPAMQERLGIATDELPVLWDCDFLLGPMDASGADTYVLCEINASSVAPFPEAAILPVARAAIERALAAKART